MLNVDAHSARIPQHKKMTVSQFISNNRGVDGGANLPDSLLKRLYTSVVTREIRIEQREFIQFSFESWLYKRGGRWRSWRNRRYHTGGTSFYPARSYTISALRTMRSRSGWSLWRTSE
jgi:hypothetical protein